MSYLSQHNIIIRVDPSVPKDEVHFKDSHGNVIYKIINLNTDEPRKVYADNGKRGGSEDQLFQCDMSPLPESV